MRQISKNFHPILRPCVFIESKKSLDSFSSSETAWLNLDHFENETKFERLTFNLLQTFNESCDRCLTPTRLQKFRHLPRSRTESRCTLSSLPCELLKSGSLNLSFYFDWKWKVIIKKGLHFISLVKDWLLGTAVCHLVIADQITGYS